jgi:hypothetical protein
VHRISPLMEARHSASLSRSRHDSHAHDFKKFLLVGPHALLGTEVRASVVPCIPVACSQIQNEHQKCNVGLVHIAQV